MGGVDDDGDRLHLLHLPEDLMIEILLLLPIVSLLRFKTVCKSWRSLIGSHDFLHPKHDNSKLGTIIFQSILVTDEVYRAHFFLLSGDVDFEVVEEFGLPPYLVDADFFDWPRGHEVNMVGSCHGIICIHDVLTTRVQVDHDVVLWNPVTKQFRILPRPPLMDFGFGDCRPIFFAFGFDVESKDYKVLLVTSFTCRDCDGGDRSLERVQVYSLRTNSWRYVDIGLSTLCLEGPYQNPGRYLNGCCLVMGRQPFDKEIVTEGDVIHIYGSFDDIILSFDFGKELFRAIQPPNDCMREIYTISEKLACTTSGDFEVYEVWVLDDYLIEVRPSSWTKLYRVGPYPGFGTGPMASSTKGELCILRTTVLQLWNSLTQESKYCQFDESVKVQKTDVYKRSLVSIS